MKLANIPVGNGGGGGITLVVSTHVKEGPVDVAILLPETPGAAINVGTLADLAGLTANYFILTPLS